MGKSNISNILKNTIMQLSFKNEHIFFALDEIWESLNYKFKYQINQLVIINSEADFVQTVSVDEETLIKVVESLSAQREGIAVLINKEMQSALEPQLLQASNIELVQAGTEEPNEASRVLMAIDAINKRNADMKSAKVENGKLQILK